MTQLHNVQDAIKQAIEGGYDISKQFRFNLPRNYENSEVLRNDVLLDPLFWQALGKGRGWKGEDWKYFGTDWFKTTRMSGGDETKFWESLP